MKEGRKGGREEREREREESLHTTLPQQRKLFAWDCVSLCVYVIVFHHCSHERLFHIASVSFTFCSVLIEYHPIRCNRVILHICQSASEQASCELTSVFHTPFVVLMSRWQATTGLLLMLYIPVAAFLYGCRMLLVVFVHFV